MKYITNIKQEMIELTKELKRGHEDYISSMDKTKETVFTKLETKILKKALTKEKTLVGLKHNPASFFYKRKRGIPIWHYDYRIMLKKVLICSWPHQTEFLIINAPEKKEDFLQKIYNFDNRYEDEPIKYAIKMGWAKIFRPKRGEVWLVDGTQLHRSNPVGEGKIGLLIRWWLQK